MVGFKFFKRGAGKERAGYLPPVVNVMGVKGGVGKTMVDINLMHQLNRLKFYVGAIDGDVDSPNLHELLGLHGLEMTIDENNNFNPVKAGSMTTVFSTGLICGTGKTAFTKRGSQVQRVLKDAFRYTNWSDRDVLVVDLPAGSGDELLVSLKESKQLIGSIIVSNVEALSDLERAAEICDMTETNIIGVILNKFGTLTTCGKEAICPDCGKPFMHELENTVKKKCEELDIKYFGRIPTSEQLLLDSVGGKPILLKSIDEPVRKAAKIIQKYFEE